MGPATDKRFAGAAWSRDPRFEALAGTYLAQTDLLRKALDAAPLDERSKAQWGFALRQISDALSPANILATNPEALQLAVESGGASLAEGFRLFTEDLTKGRISMTDDTAFEVGRNVCLSEGSVVFQNELIQLIQYTPGTAQVHQRPLLIVPPCINKYYILDLQPANSFVAYAVSQAGVTTVGTLHTAWAAARTRTKATTDAKLEWIWNVHVRDRWQAVAVSAVQTTAIRSWVAGLTAAGSGAATVENALGLLRMICETAVEDRRIVRNPCDPVKPPRRKHAARGHLTHGQVAALVDAIGVHTLNRRGGHSVDVLRPTHSVVVMFLAYTGLRWGEMAALKVSSSDMLRRRVTVTEAVAEVRGKLVWDTPKGHERRSVPFPKFLATPLAALMVGKGRDDLVFTGDTGEVLRVSSFRPNMFLPAVARCRTADPMFLKISPHDCGTRRPAWRSPPGRTSRRSRPCSDTRAQHSRSTPTPVCSRTI